MPRTTTALVCSALSFAVGIWAFIKTQQVTGPVFEPIVAACTSKDYATMEDFVEKTGYHAYDKRVGLVAFDFLVCLITQFLLDLTKFHPAGLIAWGTIVSISFPVTVLSSLEAGRQDNKGPILWPTFNGFLMQLFGISVIFPAIWVPAYTYGVGNNNNTGVVSPTLAKVVFFMSLPASVFSFLVFYLETDSSLWTTCAGILGGPVLPLVGLLIWLLPPPSAGSITNDEAQKTAIISALSFGMAGIASFLVWLYIVYMAVSTYGSDHPTTLLNDLWWEANPSVAFMTIDAGVLWIGLILHIGSRNVRNMVEALVTTPIFGPGAACAMALVSLETDRASQLAALANQQKKKS